MPRRPVVLAASLALLLAACSPQASGGPDRSVAVRMSDAMRYSPDAFDFFTGETVRFEVTNEGLSRHEFFVGDLAAHEEHAAEMREMADDPMGHDEPGLLTLEAGESGTLDYTFSDVGQ